MPAHGSSLWTGRRPDELRLEGPLETRFDVNRALLEGDGWLGGCDGMTVISARTVSRPKAGEHGHGRTIDPNCSPAVLYRGPATVVAVLRAVQEAS